MCRPPPSLNSRGVDEFLITRPRGAYMILIGRRKKGAAMPGIFLKARRADFSYGTRTI